MQITETVSDGLRRQLRVTVPANELQTRVNTKLEDIKGKVKLNGFRPGKVPLERVRQLYGRSVMAEVLEETVGETSNKALEERKERPAFQPEIKLPEDQGAVERMIEGASDLEFTMSFEVLPKVELTELKTISITRAVAKPDEEDVDKALTRLLEANTAYDTKEGTAEAGDRVTIDFKGSVDGEVFAGGTGEDAQVVIGSGNFIPGFEEGLVGAAAGSERELNVTFPVDYQAKDLAGKDAVFAVTIKEVAGPVKAEANDEFAKTLGLESIEKLRDAIRGELQKDLDKASRARLKKTLLDALDERHSFQLPQSLVDAEFEGIWRNVTRQLEQSKQSFADQGATEEKTREDYRRVAERRVRLGLVLSEIGTENEIKISEDELRRAMIDRAKQFPGQERMVLDFYKKNPNAINELRAPVYEEKVINFALELVKIEDDHMTPQALLELAAEQQKEDALFEGGAEEDTHDHNHDHDHDHQHDHGDGCGPDCGHDHGHDHA